MFRSPNIKEQMKSRITQLRSTLISQAPLVTAKRQALKKSLPLKQPTRRRTLLREAAHLKKKQSKLHSARFMEPAKATKKAMSTTANARLARAPSMALSTRLVTKAFRPEPNQVSSLKGARDLAMMITLIWSRQTTSFRKLLTKTCRLINKSFRRRSNKMLLMSRSKNSSSIKPLAPSQRPPAPLVFQLPKTVKKKISNSLTCSQTPQPSCRSTNKSLLIRKKKHLRKRKHSLTQRLSSKRTRVARVSTQI